jgi:hypothetical protein
MYLKHRLGLRFKRKRSDISTISLFVRLWTLFITNTMSDIATDYLVLWASQTGNAEWIAKNIHTEAGKKGYTGQCFVMDDFALVSLGLY